jgi:hypothetical protein
MDEEPSRSSKIYVPIDISRISRKLKVDPDTVFGRLYYHLDKKHGHKQADGSSVHLFMLSAGQDRHITAPKFVRFLSNGLRTVEFPL